MKWKCNNCTCEKFEEVLEGVTQSSEVIGMERIDTDTILFDYGNTSSDGGDYDTIRFQCMECGTNISPDELQAMI